MAKTKPNAKASLSGDKVITRICATRVLKNAKVIRKAAPHIIPPEEPLEGFRSLVPVDILKRFHRMSEADLRDYPELVYTADDEIEFCDAIRNALSEDPALPELRRKEAAKHTWQRRIDAYVDVFEKAIAAASAKSQTRANVLPQAQCGTLL